MSPVSQIDLIVPGIFERLGDWSRSYGSLPSFPQLEHLRRIADTRPVDVCGYEASLWQLFDLRYSPSEELPIAALLSGEGDAQLCCSDPVHLRAEMSSLMLVDQSQFSLSDDERSAFSQLVNAHIREMGGTFFFAENGCGYLGLPESRAVTTTPLSQVAGESIFPLMPHGEQQSFWHRLMNEFQMLLHDAPFNQARMKRGEPAVNGMWLWGAGQLQRPLTQRYSTVYCNESLAAELARSVGVAVKPLPAKYESALIPAGGKHGLMVFSALLPHCQYDDFSGWQSLMEGFCADWLAPLMDAVKRKQLSRLCLYPCNGACYVLEPGHRWRFWRREKPLYTHHV